jgi:uncharacterized protein YjbJ (UPF0337 family)
LETKALVTPDNLRELPCRAIRNNQSQERLFRKAIAQLRSFKMTGKGQEIKGRVEEAAGAIIDDDKLRREGQTDQAVGKVKQAVEKVVDKTKDAVNRIIKP